MRVFLKVAFVFIHGYSDTIHISLQFTSNPLRFELDYSFDHVWGNDIHHIHHHHIINKRTISISNSIPELSDSVNCDIVWVNCDIVGLVIDERFEFRPNRFAELYLFSVLTNA